MSDALLLDTHAWVWYAEGSKRQLPSAVLAAIDQARLGNRLYVSSISVWEIGMLCAKEKISLSAPVSDWIRRALDVPGLRLLLLDAETALESTQLPDSPHGDPADRFLIAAARIHGLRLVTADRKIREYGKVGHAQILGI
ncbi:type II toxin-antitoxin system VapC family toxin [Acidithiobacillus ferrooxidans]|uniref:type II toxin-antitoxin system VapC family toxin n=1 Tax=Acidithiobacillus ferrooxidans TaxID=920 RepID=UPI001C077BFD|nr:type II toxin-antitoxin system VapC family toxin [Acidithiobacillus ferrooxidans]MBU2809508.1 type II toxin-antitoxin system VapC family toxin [Acidithiobacillus ferrooxidans F221]MCR2829944.1 type II toxin-antitoxin system VapC family toxin [Acidithiobacillus ferrooxidans]